MGQKHTASATQQVQKIYALKNQMENGSANRRALLHRPRKSSITMDAYSMVCLAPIPSLNACLTDYDDTSLIIAGTHWHCPEGVAEPCTAQLGDYNLGLHIVLLVSSGVGVWLPVLFASKKATQSRYSRVVVYVRRLDV
jgi:hypothetical protein